MRSLSEEGRETGYPKQDDFGTYLDLAGVIFVVIDSTGQVVSINRNACTVLGYGYGELQGKNWFDTVIPERVRCNARARFAGLVAGSRSAPWHREEAVLTAGGEELTLTWNDTILEDEAGNITGLLSIGKDITGQVQVRTPLSESPDFLGVLIDTIPTPVFFKDSAGIYRGCNEAAEAYFGKAGERIAGKTVYDVLPGDLADVCHHKDQEFFEHPGNRAYETEIPHADGTRHSIVFHRATYHNHAGDVTGVIGVIQDVTEQRRMEEQARESELLFRRLFERSGDANLLIDGNRFVDCNEAAIGMLKATEKEQILRLHPSTLSPEYQADDRISSDKADEMISTALKEGSHHFEWIHRRLDGTPFPVEVSLTAIPFHGKKILHVTWRDITARKKMEEALRSERETFFSILHHAPYGVILLDSEARFLYLNPKTTEITGYSLEDVPTGREWFRRAFPDAAYRRTVVGEWLQCQARKDEITDVDFHVTCKEGRQSIITFRTAFLEDGRAVIMLRDITEERRIQGTIKESEDKFRGLVERSSVGVYIIQDDTWKYVNQRFAEIHGYPAPGPLYGLDPEQTVVPEDRLLVRENIRRQISGETASARFAFRIQQPDKGVRYIEVYGSRMTYQGRPAVIGTVIDVTARKEAEMQLLNERQRFLTLSESAPFGMVIVDPSGRFSYINPKFRELFGYELAEIPNGRTWFKKAYPDREYRRFVTATWRTDTESLHPGEKRPRSFTVRCKDGGDKIINFISVALDSGEHLMTCEDITELKHNEARLAYLATHDVLTGLPNRRYLEDILQKSIARAKRGTPSSLLFMDLDYFKIINDTIGHDAGDKALVIFAKLLSVELRGEDTVFRLGGDEFAVLLDGVSAAEAYSIAERIRVAVEAFPFSLCERDFHLALSIGVVEIDGNLSPMVLLSRADAAMYKAKEMGRNLVVIHGQ
jgi:diguanylate cyclase (GGDEF)-like protein/PAS domain S-box-containing protein